MGNEIELLCGLTFWCVYYIICVNTSEWLLCKSYIIG